MENQKGDRDGAIPHTEPVDDASPVKKHNLALKTFSAMLMTVASKIVGFLRMVVFAAVFGATGTTDAFYMAQSIALTLTSVASYGLSATIVPIRTEIDKKDGRAAADRYTSSIFNIVVIFTMAISIIVVAFPGFFVRIFAPLFTGEQFTQTNSMLRITAVLIVITAITQIYNNTLNAHHRYTIPQMTGLPFSACTIAFALLLGRSSGVAAMLLGYMTGTVVQMILVSAFSRKLYHHTFALDFKDPYVRKSIRMAGPIFLSSYVDIVNYVVDRALASGLVVGSVSAINYSHQLIEIANGIITIPIITTLLTVLSEVVAHKDIDTFKALVRRAGSVILIILAPVTLVFCFFSMDIIKVMFERGNFDSIATALTNQPFFFYALGLVPMALQSLFARCYLAMQDAKTPLITSAIGASLNIVLNLLLIGPMQAGGLALATSISYAFMSVIKFLLLRKKIGAIGALTWLKDAARVLLGVGAMLGVMVLFSSLIDHTMLKLIASCAAGGLLYFAVLLVLKQQDVTMVFHKAMQKLRGR